MTINEQMIERKRERAQAQAELKKATEAQTQARKLMAKTRKRGGQPDPRAVADFSGWGKVVKKLTLVVRAQTLEIAMLQRAINALDKVR